MIHEFESKSLGGAVIEEISTQSIKSDSYYLDKKILKNKNRKSFKLSTSEEMLKNVLIFFRKKLLYIHRKKISDFR